MNKAQITAEYDITGSRHLGFDTHPAASLQCLVGAFLPSESGVSVSNGSTPKDGAPADSPRGVTERISVRFEAFRAALDAWKKNTKKLLSGKLPRDRRGFVQSLEAGRDALELESVQLVFALREAHAALAVCAAGVRGDAEAGFLIHLGLPSPVDSAQLSKPARVWERALLQAGAFDKPQDPEAPHLVARADFIAEEMLESLKEITRESKWLLTNEPDGARVTSLMQWLFDLRCECLEIAPALACLKTPLDIWQSSTQAPERAATNGAHKPQPPAKQA